MMATEAEHQSEYPVAKEVTPVPEEQTHDSETELESDTQETPEFTEKEFPPLPSPSSEASKDTEHESKFLDRVNSIPLVVEGISLVKGFVNDGTTPYSKLAKYAYNTAGSAISTATEIVETRFPEQLSAADQLASKSLEYLEDQFPAVFHKSSSEVYEDSRQAISHIVATPTAAIDATLTTVATNAEAVLDRFLPPTEDEKEGADTGLGRLRNVGTDAQRRVYRVVRTQFDTLTSVSGSDSLLHLKSTNVYFQKASEELASLNEKLTAAIHATKDNLTSIKDSGVDLVLNTPAHLTQRIKSEVESVSKYVKENTNLLPESVKAQIEPTLEFFSDKVTKISTELQRNDLTTVDKAKNAIALATESVPYLDAAREYITAILSKKEQQGEAKPQASQ